MSIPIASFVTVAAALVSLSWPLTSVHQTVTANYPLAQSGSLAVENISGDIKVHTWTGEGVRVTVLKRAPSQAVLEQLGFEAHATGNKLAIQATYPRSCTNCSIDFEILVPRSISLDARAESGDIGVSGLGGDLTVETMSGNTDIHDNGGKVVAHAASGSISVTGASSFEGETASGDVTVNGIDGDIHAQTASGSVSVRVTSAAGSRRIALSAVSGDVTLELPRATGATIDAETVNGSIRSDFGRPQSGYVGAALHQSVGNGQVQIRLDTTSGDIRLLAR